MYVDDFLDFIIRVTAVKPFVTSESFFFTRLNNDPRSGEPVVRYNCEL